MPATAEDLFRRLGSLGIGTTTVPYPAHSSVEEGMARRGEMEGTFTKNLLLRDKKQNLFLVAAEETRSVDLKTLHRAIGAHGRLGFAPLERLTDVLGILPGALTPFALINDDKHEVRTVLDKTLLEAEQLNFHPLVNTLSTAIRPNDLLRFIRACGHEPLIVDFEALR